MLIQQFEVGPLATNAYLVADESTGEAALIDPGLESESLLEAVRQREWNLRWVINTHGHFDHADGDAYFVAQTGAELLIHADDVPLLQMLPQQAAWFGMTAHPAPPPNHLLQDGDEVHVGRLSLRVLHTPGHTPGGICLLSEREGEAPVLFSGDTLFAGSLGRTDLVGGNEAALLRSIRRKLFSLPEHTLVLPGHGPQTTIGQERRFNPFVGGLL